MALVNQDLVLDVVPGPIPRTLHLTEYDENMEVVVTLQRRGQPFQIPTGTTVKIEGTLKGHPFSEDGTPSGNTVTFMVSKSMTAYAGRAWTKIKLTQNSKPVSTCGFWLDCDRAGVEAGAVIQDSGFQEQIQQAVEDYLDTEGVVSPSVTITEIEGGKRITFTDAAHPHGQSIDLMDGADGLPSAAKVLLITILRNALYKTDQSANITALEAAIGAPADNITLANGVLTILALANDPVQSGAALTIS